MIINVNTSCTFLTTPRISHIYCETFPTSQNDRNKSRIVHTSDPNWRGHCSHPLYRPLLPHYYTQLVLTCVEQLVNSHWLDRWLFRRLASHRASIAGGYSGGYSGGNKSRILHTSLASPDGFVECYLGFVECSVFYAYNQRLMQDLLI